MSDPTGVVMTDEDKKLLAARCKAFKGLALQADRFGVSLPSPLPMISSGGNERFDWRLSDADWASRVTDSHLDIATVVLEFISRNVPAAVRKPTSADAVLKWARYIWLLEQNPSWTADALYSAASNDKTKSRNTFVERCKANLGFTPEALPDAPAEEGKSAAPSGAGNAISAARKGGGSTSVDADLLARFEAEKAALADKAAQLEAAVKAAAEEKAAEEAAEVEAMEDELSDLRSAMEAAAAKAAADAAEAAKAAAKTIAEQAATIAALQEKVRGFQMWGRLYVAHSKNLPEGSLEAQLADMFVSLLA